jgi:hypothetical protein
MATGVSIGVIDAYIASATDVVCRMLHSNVL